MQGLDPCCDDRIAAPAEADNTCCADYLWPPCGSSLGARIEQDVNIQQSAGLSDLQQEG